MNNKKIRRDPYNTILVICIGFALIYSVNKQKWELNVSLVIGIAALLSRRISLWIEFIWLQIAKLLGMIMPNIMLGIVYFVILTPIAFISRLFSKKDPMGFKKDTASTFTDYDRKFDAEYFENPW